MIYDKLTYEGKSHSITIGILPRRTQVRITADEPYYFKEGDSQDERAIQYYEALANAGLRLHKIDDQDLIQEEVKEVEDKIESVEEPVVETPATEEITEEVVEEQDTTEEETINEEVITSETTEATSEEMIEFLDLTYSEDELYGIAKEAGIKRVQSSWDKSTLINKIINANPDYVVSLIKSNS